MTNLITHGKYDALNEIQQQEHAQFVAARWESILGHFFDKNESPGSRALTIADGVDVLKHYSTDEINAAWKKERETQISGYGYLKMRVSPEQIEKRILAARPRPERDVVAEKPEEPRIKVTSEQSNAILKELGFSHIPTVQNLVKKGMKR